MLTYYLPLLLQGDLTHIYVLQASTEIGYLIFYDLFIFMRERQKEIDFTLTVHFSCVYNAGSVPDPIRSQEPVGLCLVEEVQALT